jgi:hypothetical protein
MSTKISWLQDFYGWEKLDENFFTINEWININGDIQLIRIDPKFAAKNMFIASKIKFLGDFRLYQCDSPSLIREKIPLRFFYNKVHGKVYDMMDFINQIEDYERVTRLDLSWSNQKNIYSYIKIFFDNVKGRHGRFEIIENYEFDLLNRVRTHEIYSGEKIKEPFTSEQKDYQRRIYEFLKTNNIHLKVNEGKKDELLVENVCTLFRNSLFLTTVIFKTDKENFGQIEMKNEIILDYHYFLKKAFSDKDDLKDYQNIETLADINVGYFENVS